MITFITWVFYFWTACLSLSHLTGSSEADQIPREVTKQTPQRPDDGRGQAGSVSTCMSLIMLRKELKFIQLYFLSHLSWSYVWLIRRCLMSSWMRTSWKMHVNTLRSTWKFTGVPRISPVLPLLTPYWTKVWSHHPQLTPANR